MYYLSIAIVFLAACSFPAALINALRAEDREKADNAKLWACISFGLVMVFVSIGISAN